MAIYLIHACDQTYGGLHGIEDWDIIEGTKQEAESQAENMSIEVQYNYDFIASMLREDAEEYARNDGVSELDWEERISEIEENLAHENAEWQVIQLREDKTLDEYLQMLREGKIDWEEIRDLYGMSCRS